MRVVVEVRQGLFNVAEGGLGIRIDRRLRRPQVSRRGTLLGSAARRTEDFLKKIAKRCFIELLGEGQSPLRSFDALSGLALQQKCLRIQAEGDRFALPGLSRPGGVDGRFEHPGGVRPLLRLHVGVRLREHRLDRVRVSIGRRGRPTRR